MPEGLIDVVMMVDAFGEAEQRPTTLPKHFREEVQLTDDLKISPLWDLRSDLLEACEPRGIGWSPPTKSFGVDYAIERTDAPEPYFSFDPDRRLWTCVQLSRLVRPTSIGMGKGGRLTLDGSGNVERFAPSNVDGCAGRSWVSDTNDNWLRDEDVHGIIELLVRFDPSNLPERVLQALWQHEFIHQMYFVDVRWPLAATGLESLIHTDKYRSTKQFVQRLLGVQESLGISLADEPTLERLYDRRSAVAHGARLGELDPLTRSDYMTLEHLLRVIVRSAILDPGIASLFENSAAIKKEWPI